MCSELLRIPIEWSGVPLFGFGVFLLFWLLAGGIWVAFSSKHVGLWQAVRGCLPGVIMGAAVIVGIAHVFPDGLPIRGYGVMVLLGAVLALSMAAARARQRNLDPEVIFSLAVGMFVCGIIGARVFYVIEYWESRFQRDRWQETLFEVLKFTEGGLVVYGSLIGATVAFFWFVRRRHLPALAMADLIAPSLMAGLALGRIGCLLNGCCYGGETGRPWAVTFPRASVTYLEQLANGRMAGMKLYESPETAKPSLRIGVDPGSLAAEAGLVSGMNLTAINGNAVHRLGEARLQLLIAIERQRPIVLEVAGGETHVLPVLQLPERSLPVHPTQVYSAIHAGLLSWFLWAFYPYRRRDGQVIALLLTIYPISRFLLEIIRVDESPVFGTGLSISQNVSLGIFLIAIAIWVVLRRMPNQPVEFGSDAEISSSAAG